MKLKYVLAGALVALLAVPGTASQLAARAALNAPLAAPPVAVSTAGLFHDPNAEPQLSITLPARFEAITVGAGELQHFAG
jgi:hypothetical protein